MTLAIMELQKEIFKILKNDSKLTTEIGERKIFDYASTDTALPYISFGKTSSYDWSTDSELGFEHLITLNVWAKESQKQVVLSVMENIKHLLHDQNFYMEGYVLVNIRLDSSEIRYDGNLSKYHGLLRFRAVTEPLKN